MKEMSYLIIKKTCPQTAHLNFNIKKEMKPPAVSRMESHNDHDL
jgi:hypothetical protein